MKIIAKIREGQYLLEATGTEIDLLAGRKVVRGDYGDDRSIEYVVGTQFNIVAAFSQIHRNATRKEDVIRLRQLLNALMVGLDMTEPFIEEPKPPEPAEEQPTAQ